MTPHKPVPTIDVRASGIHGLGGFASRELSKGEKIGVYAGRRYSATQAAARDWDSSLTYLFGLADGTLIDASDGGNATRHVNHSCRPNCVAYEEPGPRGKPVIVFYARRRIAAGEELSLDYRLDAEDDDATNYACACGAPRCRGTMRAKSSGKSASAAA